MAKYITIPTVIEGNIYEKGMEDGFDRCDSVTCREFNRFDWDCPTCPEGKGRPYIYVGGNKNYIQHGDCIVTYSNGSKHVIKSDEFNLLYKKIEELNDYMICGVSSEECESFCASCSEKGTKLITKQLGG